MPRQNQFFPASWDEFILGLTTPNSVCKDSDNFFPDLNSTEKSIYNGYEYQQILFDTWPIAATAAVGYLVVAVALPPIMKNREAIKPKAVLVAWNLLLCLYSCLGTYFVGKKLLFGAHGGLITTNFDWHATLCTHSDWYCNGYSGLFVLLFVLGKLPELIDTLWLLLAKRPVMLLHWWHHFSVLLWSWHSYISATSFGIVFGYMNYQVHSIMYFYYGMTQLGPTAKNLVRPFAIWVTRIQILQMFGGIFVLCSAFFFNVVQGRECWVDSTNNVLAVICYASYLFLFLKFYMSRYLLSTGKKGGKKKRA